MTGPHVCVALKEPDVEYAARLYKDVFLADEPTSHRHGLDPDLFLPYAQMYVRSLVRKDLSFIVRDPVIGTPVGFIFCFDLTEDPGSEGPQMVSFLRHFREAVAMIKELEDRTLDRSSISPGLIVHIFQIGVDRQFRGTGIAHALIRQVCTRAEERGFSRVIADCTGPVSRRVFEQCGFHEAGFFPYDEFTYNGNRFFAGLDGGISLMINDL